jgi:hypothetical protein
MATMIVPARGLAVGVCALAMLLAAGGARAQDRPDEDAMFGGSPAGATATSTGTATSTASEAGPGAATTTKLDATRPAASGTDTGAATAAPAPSPPSAGGDARDALNLGDPDAAVRFSNSLAPEDPLKIGGQFYWRVMSTGRQAQYPQNWSLSAPALVDTYLDARPNERVRAFVLGRMSYDPTLAPNGSTGSSGSLSGTSAQGGDSLSSVYGQQTRGPSVALDQLWLRFDLKHTVFVTAGKQHVRWGTARFWAPTDYFHMQTRNPLLPFDPRTGTTMLKIDIPWEEKGWNFYAYALPEGPSTTSHPGDVTGAARAEVVLGTLEMGAGVFGQRSSKAKFAGDVSFGLWDLDFYGEAALRNAGDVDFVSFQRAQFMPDVVAPGQAQTYTTTNTTPPVTIDPGQWQDSTYQSQNLPLLVDAFYPVHRGSGWKPQATGGVSYTRQYADKDTFTVGAEYFYNGLGYSDASAYPGVVFLPHATPLRSPATFFYLGRHYLAIFATAPAPYSWDNTTFTLSSLANLSDKSGITRLDYSLVLLTHIRFEAYGAVHWGQRNGEFRFGLDGSALGDSIAPVRELAGKLSSQPALFDVGVGLRVAL